MSIPQSTVPAAKQALYTAIVTEIADPEVLVSYDITGVDLPDDIVVVGNVERQVRPSSYVGSGGQFWLEEEYEIAVGVSVFRGGAGVETASAVDVRFWQLISIIEAAIRVDPSLGGIVTEARPQITRTENGPEKSHKGLIAEGELKVHCLAII